MNFLEDFNQEKGVFQLSKLNNQFESSYLEIRQKENRILSDEQVKILPTVKIQEPHAQEWELRRDSTDKVVSYLGLKQFNSALDLGCGNGWFTHKLALKVSNVIGVDLNMPELEQAARVFTKPNLQFCYADVFKAQLPSSHFDLITLNASVQYFSSLPTLLQRLFELLTDEGEIHLIDSPIYASDNVESARKRTIQYYQSMNAEEMAPFYYHHTWKSLSSFSFDVNYDPLSIGNRLMHKLGFKVSPFPWIVIRR